MPDFVWPFAAPWTITRGFQWKDAIYLDGQHGAIDIIPHGRPALGEPILAIADGECFAYPYNDYYGGWNSYIDHADGWRSGYRHMRERGISGHVVQGQVIGYCDNTGVSLGSHLHFDLWNRTKRSLEAYLSKVGWWKHDPEVWLDKTLEEDDMWTEDEKKLVLGRLTNIDNLDDANAQQLAAIVSDVAALRAAVATTLATLQTTVDNTDDSVVAQITAALKILKPTLTALETSAIAKFKATGSLDSLSLQERIALVTAIRKLVP